MSKGSLTIVGTGIQFAAHLTLGAKAWIEHADTVLFAVADPATAAWLQELNPAATAIPYDTTRENRGDTYREMVVRILDEVRSGRDVCAVFYGHPGVFTGPAHAAMRMARREGFPAQMMPGISAEDCMFADLAFDPAEHGCQSFEATDFLIRRRKFDPNSFLILWQIAITGNIGFYEKGSHVRGLTVLSEVLEPCYGRDHEVVVYEAATYPACEPVIERMALCQLPGARVSEISTLFVPPAAVAPIDKEMQARLGLTAPGSDEARPRDEP